MSLDGIDYFLIVLIFLIIFISSFAGDLPSAHVSFGLNHKDFLPTALPDVRVKCVHQNRVFKKQS